MFTHGITFGGHPVACAIALKNLEIMQREHVVEHVAEFEPEFHASLATLQELPIAGDLRGVGFFWALELVKDKDARARFPKQEIPPMLTWIREQFLERGIICRVDDRGDPVVQFSPPLVAGRAEVDEMVSIVGGVLEEASEKFL
jgi:adenosylmethionine-8-amino-7-oxononanoate aminotransferase